MSLMLFSLFLLLSPLDNATFNQQRTNKIILFRMPEGSKNRNESTKAPGDYTCK